MPTPPSDVAHLLRRTGFGAPRARVDQLALRNRDQIVAEILNVPNPIPAVTRPPFVDDPAIDSWTKFVSMLTTWVDQMGGASHPIVEKMTLFWHGHFTSAVNKVGKHNLMVDQHAFYRRAGVGKLEPLAQGMALMPAMLDYLDNSENRKKSPNENFARELLELFLLGVQQFEPGVPNYQESDVVAAARAWTGHSVNWQTGIYSFIGTQHDYDPKTFLGEVGAWDGPDTVRIALNNARTRPIAARFICTKLWEFFAHPGPPAAALSAMESAFLASDLNITSALSAMFNHDEFYSSAAKQGHVRTPAEYVVAAVRALGVTAATVHPEWYMWDMGQELYNPPDVSGWRHNEYWLSTASASVKFDFANHCTWTLSDQGRHPFANSTTLTPEVLVQRGFDLFEIHEPSPATRQALLDWVARQRAANQGWAEPTQFLVLLMMTPDLQLG